MSKPTRKQRLIRKEFPKVRQLRRRGNTYYAVELAQSVQANGVPSVAKNIANLDDEKLTRWNEQLGAHGKTIEGAVGFMLEHLDKEQRRRESEHVGSLLSKWTLDRVENKLKPMRPRSSKSLRDMANRFKADSR